MPLTMQTAFAAGTATTMLVKVTFSGNIPNYTLIRLDVVTNTGFGGYATYKIFNDGEGTVSSFRVGGNEDSVFSTLVNGLEWSYLITPGTGQPDGNAAVTLYVVQTDDSIEPDITNS